MGTLIYAGPDGFEFDDRVLAHLQALLATKLRRQEGFLLIWTDRTGSPIGTLRSIWLDHSISMQFAFSGPAIPKLNREWLEAMAQSADADRGMVFEDDLRRAIREDDSAEE